MIGRIKITTQTPSAIPGYLPSYCLIRNHHVPSLFAPYLISFYWFSPTPPATFQNPELPSYVTLRSKRHPKSSHEYNQ